MITECYVDGSFRPEGSAAAVVIYRNRKEVFRTVKPVPVQASMPAECEAILLAVNLCFVSNYHSPTIYTDSRSFFDQYQGHVNPKKRNLAHYVYALRQIERIFPFTLVNVKRTDVFVPDDMCKKFIKAAYQFHEQNLKEP